MVVFFGVVMILVGIVALAFPDLTRSWDRFQNDLDGVETKQGSAYEFNRVFSAGTCILAGVVVILMWYSI